jgi:hypothetical protein
LNVRKDHVNTPARTCIADGFLRRSTFNNFEAGVAQRLRDCVSQESLVLDDKHERWRGD